MRIRVLGETHPETAESRRLVKEIQAGHGAWGEKETTPSREDSMTGQ